MWRRQLPVMSRVLGLSWRCVLPCLQMLLLVLL
jgi:hypothetical protein